MKSRSNLVAMFIACLALASMVSLSAFAHRGDDKKDGKKTDQQAMRDSAWDALQTLQGTWVKTEPGPDGKPSELVFKLTGNGSVLMETMFPGSKFEMQNAYHMDNDRLIVTHYCAQGVQPRMKLVSHENGTMKFDFLDGTNLKPGEGHMGGLEITVNGEQLIEKWSSIKDGQVTDATTFEFTKKG
ncbi:MAG: hypothetical protein H7Z14_11640 [Anaerolineae bacterium]|nr:hypothetical protein [Phycisphaerae bacterium]